MTIGDLVRHPEWQARTSGAIDYTGDIRLDNMLVGKILRSPHAHARILDIDTTGADGLTGWPRFSPPTTSPTGIISITDSRIGLRWRVAWCVISVRR